MVRHWTVLEADAALPAVREALAEARAIIVRLREARDQLEDLQIIHGDAAAEVDEFVDWQEVHRRGRQELEKAMLRFAALGVEVKDVESGLVDFRARLGAQEVYLCWKDGEDKVAWWHTLDGGFARRRPVPDFTPV